MQNGYLLREQALAELKVNEENHLAHLHACRKITGGPLL